MRIRQLLLVALLLLVGAGPSSAREGDAPRLTLDRLFGGRPLVRRLPGWRWRPGHGELVRIHAARGRTQLLARGLDDPTERVLLDWKDLPRTGRPVPGRGIGRASFPRLRWTKDGRAACATKGGDLYWVQPGTDNDPIRLTGTEAPIADPRPSPDGRLVSFTRDHDVHVVATDGTSAIRLTEGGSDLLRNGSLDWVYPEEFGFQQGTWWSPDSRHLAFLQLDQTSVPTHRLPRLEDLRGEGRVMRYPRAGDANPSARLGVVAASGGEVRWLDDLGTPEPAYIVRVAWTPDARHVLVVVMDRAQQHLRLLACDPTGVRPPAVLLEERDAAWIDAPPAPRFVDATRFLWRTDADGSRRWHLLALDPSAPRIASRLVLTPAGHEAGDVRHIDVAAGRVLVEATRHGTSSRVLLEAWGAGGEDDAAWSRPARVAPTSAGWTTARVSPDGRHAIVTTSTATLPPREELRDATDGRVLALLGDGMTNALSRIALAEPETIELPIEGGAIRIRLWKPPDLAARLAAEPSLSLPLLVHVYAGPGSRMVRDAWGRGPLFRTMLVERGLLVAEIDGRGSGGQGAAFQRLVRGRLGLLELADQVRGVKALTARPYIDADRVGIWGWSYGGTMACQGLLGAPDVFRVGVAVAPVTDWRLYDTIYTERYMGLPVENPYGYRSTSLVRRAAALRGRLLLMHGLGDDNVHVQNTIRLQEALHKAGRRTFDVMLYPRRGHGIGGLSRDVFGRLVHALADGLDVPALRED